MKNQKYEVKLTEKQRKELTKFIKSKSKNKTEQCKVHAKVILCLDENAENRMTPEETAEKCKLNRENVYKIRKQFVVEGMERVLYRKKRNTPPVPAKITGEVEAHIIAAACSEVPDGRQHWTLQMIADKIVLEGVIDSISDVTVMRVLKKHTISLI
jgi:hypothetical protein